MYFLGEANNEVSSNRSFVRETQAKVLDGSIGYTTLTDTNHKVKKDVTK